MTQNAAARLFFNESKRAHVTLCLSLRLRLSSFSRLWCLSTGQPQALHPPTSTLSYKSTCTPGACEVSEGHFMVPSQRGKKSLSLLLAGETIFPTLSRQPNLWQISRNRWKLISSVSTSLHLAGKKKSMLLLFHYICSHYSLIPLCSTLYYSELLYCCHFSCLLPLKINPLLYFLICKSCWIKASAKWINLNGMTWGRVSVDSSFIFGVNYPFKSSFQT